jgi:hypothetical protein
VKIARHISYKRGRLTGNAGPRSEGSPLAIANFFWCCRAANDFGDTPKLAVGCGLVSDLESGEETQLRPWFKRRFS